MTRAEMEREAAQNFDYYDGPKEKEMSTGYETVETPTSSNIKSYRYNPATYVLEVTFKNGGQYEYFGVPQETFDAMRHAPSAGGYLAVNIRGRFETRKVEQK